MIVSVVKNSLVELFKSVPQHAAFPLSTPSVFIIRVLLMKEKKRKVLF